MEKVFDSLDEIMGDASGSVGGAGNYGVSGGAPSDVVQKVLMYYVAPVVEEILIRQIATDIYDAYEPHLVPHKFPGYVKVEDRLWDGWVYENRYSLLSRNNIVKKLINSGSELFVTSDALPNTSVRKSKWKHDVGGFLQMLEDGPSKKVWRDAFPRPALSNAQEEVLNSSEVADAFKRGFRAFGQ